MTSSATTGNIGGVVVNSLHPAFQILTHWFPNEARKLLRMPALTQYADIDPAQTDDARAHAATLPVRDILLAVQGGGINGTTLTVEDLRRLAHNPGNSLQLYPGGLPIEPHRALHEYSHAINLYRTGGTQGVPMISPAQIAKIKAMGAGIAYGKYDGDPAQKAHQALDIVAKLRARIQSKRLERRRQRVLPRVP